jgi:hypothetical protein
MRKLKLAGWATVACFLLIACGNSGVEEPAESAVAQMKERPTDVIETPAGAPFTIRYNVIGTPVVGSPVTLDLQIVSAMGSQPVEISYEIPDPSSMMLHEAQPQTLMAEFDASKEFIGERVTVIPQREGRLYLNVSAAVTTEGGRVSSVMSVPIHVGEVNTGLVEHGEVEFTEDGEAVKVLKD